MLKSKYVLQGIAELFAVNERLRLRLVSVAWDAAVYESVKRGYHEIKLKNELV